MRWYWFSCKELQIATTKLKNKSPRKRPKLKRTLLQLHYYYRGAAAKRFKPHRSSLLRQRFFGSIEIKLRQNRSKITKSNLKQKKVQKLSTTNPSHLPLPNGADSQQQHIIIADIRYPHYFLLNNVNSLQLSFLIFIFQDVAYCIIR